MLRFATNVAGVPEQIVVELVLILTVGELAGVTVMVMAFELAMLVVAQVTFEVNTQLTTSLFARVVLPKLAEFVPTSIPFTFH